MIIWCIINLYFLRNINKSDKNKNKNKFLDEYYLLSDSNYLISKNPSLIPGALITS